MSVNTASASPQRCARVLACALCQQRKVKCDRQEPCSNCIKVCHSRIATELRAPYLERRRACPVFCIRAAASRDEALTGRLRPILPAHQAFQLPPADVGDRIRISGSAWPVAKCYFCGAPSPTGRRHHQNTSRRDMSPLRPLRAALLSPNARSCSR